MKRTFLKVLHCNLCGGKIKESYIFNTSELEIEWGTLKCTDCRNKFPIVFGIPIMMPPDNFVDIKRNKLFDNIRVKGPMVIELTNLVETNQIDKVERILLSPKLTRSTFYKKGIAIKPVTNKWAKRVIPGFVLKNIDIRYYYNNFKVLFAKLTFEDLRMHRQENRLFNNLKNANSAESFIKNYFQHIKINELNHYFTYRFSEPRYITAISLASIMPKSQKPILDLGCGVGHILHYLTTSRIQQECIGLDRDFEALLIAKKFVAPMGEFVFGNADMPLPFPDDSFSGVLCSDAFMFFAYKKLTINEIKRIISKEGVITLSGILNSEDSRNDYYEILEEKISPDELKKLFKGIKNMVVDSEMIQDRYFQKLGPCLSEEQRITQLNRVKKLSLIASKSDNVFCDHGLFDKWPHSYGNLQINPLYKQSGLDESGNYIYNFTFPSKWFEIENKDWLKYAPKTISLNPKLLETISNNEKSPVIEDLVNNFVVLGFPENYLDN